MRDAFTENTLKTCVCARCWSHLEECFIDGEYVIKCINPDCDGKGFVTKHYADQRRKESQAEVGDVRKLLESTGVITNPDKGKTPDQLIKEIGF